MPAARRILRALLKLLTRKGVPAGSSLVEALRPWLAERQSIVASTRDGAVFDLDLNDRIQRQIFFDVYDRPDIELLRGLLQPGDTVFDIGGNIGFYGITLAQAVAPSGAVHIFEPIPANLQAIRRNVALNGLQRCTIVNPVAVYDQARTLTLYLSNAPGNTGWASITPSERRLTSLAVDAISIDAYVAAHDIAEVRLIKIDVEGAELHVLRGMERLLQRAGAPLIYLEINPFLLRKQQTSPTTIKRYLAERGYTLWALQRGRLAPVAPEEPEQTLRNLLARKR